MSPVVKYISRGAAALSKEMCICDFDSFCQIVYHGCVTNGLPPELCESYFSTAVPAQCFTDWSRGVVANVLGEGISSGTKLYLQGVGSFSLEEAVAPGD